MMRQYKSLSKITSKFVFPVCLLAVSTAPMADVSVGYSFTSGPESYRAREFSITADLPVLPLIFDIKEFVAHGASGQIMNEQTMGLSWNVMDWLNIGYQHQNGHGDLMNVIGHEFSSSFDLSSILSESNPTRFDIRYNEISYDPNANDPVAKAAIKALLPEVQQYTLGVHQGIGANWDFSLSYDDYRYSKDPVDIARQMLRRFKRPNRGIFEIISFPDRSTSAGLTWKPVEPLSVDLSFRWTTSVLNQSQDNVRMGVTYQFNKNLQAGTAVSRSTSSEIRRNTGALIAERSGSNYFEVSANLSFD